ncbi:putative drug exporter of the RND superfamily [Actinokineospora iranica]|uniref:Putative drug exporter of the RND superfamily n=2 Tax=Actinokineospora iranica TaxID=1271860 RepID=A0A1G6JVR0_9PSEU|nr:putative drug exporter of the RND superfamily [Actinokineospora iranica]
MVRALGTGSARRPKLVVGLWAAAVLLSLTLLPHLFGALGTLPLRVADSDSAATGQVLSRTFPELGDEQMIVVFHSEEITAQDPVFQLAVSAGSAMLRTQPGVSAVQTDPPMTRGHLDPRTAYALAGLTGDDNARAAAVPAQQAALRQATAEASQGRVHASLVGVSSIFVDLRDTDMADLRRAESVALPIVAVILLLGLGAVGATALPLVFGGMVVAVGVGLLSLVSFAAPTNTLVLTLAVMTGWALGLDYAILMLLRYRQEIRARRTHDVAIGTATATAGVTACISSLAIALCSCSLLFVSSDIFRDCFIGVIIVAAVTVAAALTLMPALLGLAGRWLDLGTLPWRRKNPTGAGARWTRWAQHLMRHPWRYLTAATAALALAAAPALDFRLGLDLDRPAMAATDSGQGFLHIEEDSLPGLTAASQIMLPRPTGTPAPDTAPLTAALLADPRVVDVLVLDNGEDATLVNVVPTLPVDSPDTAAFVSWLRTVAPAHVPPDQPVGVTGPAATVADLITEVTGKTWWIIGFVLVISALFLFLCFRSLVIPLKAIMMNFLSAAATFGLLTQVYEVDSTGVLNFYLPVVTFVTLFAISMDYEMFLMRRIQEHHREHGDNRTAVAEGMRQTALPITLAASAMVTVFAALLTADRIEIRQIGFALAVAVAIDATVVRLVLVPVMLRLFGRYNWWLPRPLARLFREPVAAESLDEVRDVPVLGAR